MATTTIQRAGGHSTTFEPITVDPKSTPKHHVHTQLNYFKDNDDGSPPAPAYVGRPETYARPVQPVNVVVHDISGEVDKYTLDSHGFQLYAHISQEKDFINDDTIKSEYYPETEQLLKDATGATRIFIFGHTIRRTPNNGDSTPNSRGPVQRVHIDQSYSASRSRVPHHLPNEADHLLSHRHQIVNVWRPIKRILKDPLAVADAHSVPDSDLVPVGLIYPDRKGETLSVRANEKHQWYFKYGQTPEEVTLIKCYDSRSDRARRVPHTAFEDPEHVNGEARESIEVRALVFYEDQDAE